MSPSQSSFRGRGVRINRSGTAASRPSQDRREQKRLEAEQRQARSRERQAQKQVVNRLEKEIADLESRQAELTAALEKPETYEKPGLGSQINRELVAVTRRIEELTTEWEAAASILAEMDR